MHCKRNLTSMRHGVSATSIKSTLLGYCAFPSIQVKYEVPERSECEDTQGYSRAQLKVGGAFEAVTPSSPDAGFWNRGVIRRAERENSAWSTYCPPCFRTSTSPVNHGDSHREWSKSSSTRASSVKPDRYLASASGAGTGFAVGMCQGTELWESKNCPLSSATSYRDSFNRKIPA